MIMECLDYGGACTSIFYSLMEEQVGFIVVMPNKMGAYWNLFSSLIDIIDDNYLYLEEEILVKFRGLILLLGWM